MAYDSPVCLIAKRMQQDKLRTVLMHHFRGLSVSRAHKVPHMCLSATALHLPPLYDPTAQPATHLLPHSDVDDPTRSNEQASVSALLPINQAWDDVGTCTTKPDRAASHVTFSLGTWS